MLIIRSKMKIDEALNQLEWTIKEEFGEPCEDFNFNCAVCQVWMALDILKEHLYEIEI